LQDRHQWLWLLVAACPTPPTPAAQVRFIFDCFDFDKDGRLAVEELRQLLLTINKKLQTSTYLQVEQATERVFEVGSRGGWLNGWNSLREAGRVLRHPALRAAGCPGTRWAELLGRPGHPSQVYSRYTDGRGLRLEGLQKAYEEGAGGQALPPLQRHCQPGLPGDLVDAAAPAASVTGGSASRASSPPIPPLRHPFHTHLTTPAGDLDRDYNIVAAWEREGGRALPPIRASSYLPPSGGHSPRVPQSPRMTGAGMGFTREEKIAIMFKCFDRDADGRWAWPLGRWAAGPLGQ
jgi:hypothetical protein